MRWLRILAALLAVTTLAGCHRGSGVHFKAPIILISIDTLRADHLPAYGYRGVATPHIDDLARNGIVFDNAYSHVPLTLPSHATLFTGLLPFQDGVRDNVGYSLAETHRTIASFLDDHGYATGAAVSSIVLSHETGIARGFQFYDDDVEPTTPTQSLGGVQRSGFATEERLDGWIAHARKKPIFAFLHIYEPHAPYEPPEPFATTYHDHPYDGEIATADAVVGKFFDDLKRAGLYDRAVILLVADHGEGLSEHGEAEHGILLYREEIHVPMILKLPGNDHAGARVSSPVGLDDVFPMLARLVGLQPPDGLSRVSVAEALSGRIPVGRRIYSETLYPRLHLGWSDLASLSDSRYQYIEAPRPELYEFEKDPEERHDLAPSTPPPFRAMRLQLEGMNRPRTPPGSANPERAKKLASLGYLTGGSAPAPAGPLPDPKDHIEELGRLKDAFGLFDRHENEKAAEALRRLLAENPRLLDAWEMLAQALHRLGRDPEALEAFERADALSPGNAQILLSIANFYLDTNRLAEADRYVHLAEAAAAPQIHETLARIALARNQPETADRQARLALRDHPQARLPLLILARIARDRNDLSAAMGYLDAVDRVTHDRNLPPVSSASYLRGDVLARLGEADAAEKAFRDEVRIFPGNREAWCSLALLYGSAGDTNRARHTLLEMVRANPDFDAYRAAVGTAKIMGDGAEERALRDQERQLFGRAAGLKGG
jgi:arylsulfatase A-like enzyme/Tfp pilus assembly protein PilF